MGSLLRLSLIMVALGVSIRGSSLDNLVSVPICAISSLTDFKKCLDDFEGEISSSGDKPFEVLQARARCCSFTHLRKCVVSSADDNCGSSIGEVLDMVMKEAFKKIKDKTECQDYDGEIASFICLPDWTLGLITLGLIVLTLMACTATIRMCRPEKRYTGLPVTRSY